MMNLMTPKCKVLQKQTAVYVAALLDDTQGKKAPWVIFSKNAKELTYVSHYNIYHIAEA